MTAEHPHGVEHDGDVDGLLQQGALEGREVAQRRRDHPGEREPIMGPFSRSAATVPVLAAGSSSAATASTGRPATSVSAMSRMSRRAPRHRDPPGWNAFRLRHAVVAWDGSAPAARAVNDVLPFLRSAEAVTVVYVEEAGRLASSVPGAEFAPHLARHGGRHGHARPLAAETVETLRGAAVDTRADMIVMGACRHSRMREWFLGGVTQHLLAQSDVPLVLVH